MGLAEPLAPSRCWLATERTSDYCKKSCSLLEIRPNLEFWSKYI